jgi:transcriptional regulator with XRE-family HTH domain
MALPIAPAFWSNVAMGSLRQVLAANIVRLRQARGWSQDALAFHVQTSRRYLARVEGAQASVGLDVIERIADVLEVEAADLLKAPKAKAQK